MSDRAESLSNELTEFCKSNSLSEDGLREIIERHGLTPNNIPNITDYKFFFVACHNERVTEGIIQYLLHSGLLIMDNCHSTLYAATKM